MYSLINGKKTQVSLKGVVEKFTIVPKKIGNDGAAIGIIIGILLLIVLVFWLIMRQIQK